MGAGVSTFANLFVAVDISDDDVELAEVASQCGYDFSHPGVSDVDEPQVASWHGEDCLMMRIGLSGEMSAAALDDLQQRGTLRLSHPSVAAVTVLGIQSCA
jgi:hypothetical protein